MNNNFPTNSLELNPENNQQGGLYGWICPKCGAVMSPYTNYCVHCTKTTDPSCNSNPYYGGLAYYTSSNDNISHTLKVTNKVEETVQHGCGDCGHNGEKCIFSNRCTISKNDPFPSHWIPSDITKHNDKGE